MRKRIVMKNFFNVFVLVLLHSLSLSGRTISYTNYVLQSETFSITESGSYAFSNQGVYDYNPVDISSSSPMIKITASDVDVNFSEIGVTNRDQTHAGWIGIEIGWSPQELLDDSSREQPKNITIQNLSLYSFDCPLMIHGGVESVTVQNCSFYKTLLGIGVFGTTTSWCQDINFDNVTVFGISGNYQSVLQTFKTRVEVTFGYGSDYFMPLKADSLNADTVDVCTYYGVFAKYANNMTVKEGEIRGIGYEQYATISEGDGSRTAAVGMYICDSKRIVFKNVVISDTASEVKAVGLQLDNIQELSMYNCDFSYATSAVKSVGIEVTNQHSLAYSLSAVYSEHVETKSNVADQIAIGLDLSFVRGFTAYDLISKYNAGGIETYGLYTEKMYTADIHDSKFSENSSSHTTNDVATNHGIVAMGFYGNNVDSFQSFNVNYTSMQALNSAYGLYLNNSSSCQFFDSQFVGNIATTMRSGEAAAIRVAQDGQEISASAPVVTETETGGYGAFLKNTKYVRFERCVANSNEGHRAIGITARHCRAVGIWDTFITTQSATGGMFDSSLVTDITDPTAFPMLTVHQPLLFGDFTKSTVDMVKTTDLFLEKLHAIRSDQALGTNPNYSDVVALLASSHLLKAAIARYRTWGVAMGVHAHSVSGFILNNCTCVGQVSLFDNAVGMCFSGRNTGHTIDNCKLSFNGASYYSRQTPVVGQSYASSYDIVGMKPFWTMLLQGKTPWTVFESADLSTNVTAIAFSFDLTKLAIGTANNQIKVYDMLLGGLLETLTGFTATITSLSWSADGAQLASGSSSGTNNIKIWNTTNWTVEQTLTHGLVGVNSVHFKSDGTQLASGSADGVSNIKIWNTSTWVADQTLTHGSLAVNAVKYSYDGTKLASGSCDTTNNLKIWNTSTWVDDQTLNSHTNEVKSVDWNHDDSLVVSGSSDDTVKIWETSGWTVSQTLTPTAGNVNIVRFKPDSSLLAVGCNNNIVNIYNTSDWSIEATLTDFTGSVLDLDWSENGRMLATASSDDLYRVYATNIYKRALTTSDVGLYHESGNYKLQDSLLFNSDITNDSVFIDLTGTKYRFVSPIGPDGVGLIIGDIMVEAFVRTSSMYGNFGNAGHAYGALLNKAFSVTLGENTISGNNVNVHGFVTGILDVTAHSANLYTKNFLEGNKCSTFNNANYLIPFNPADTNSLAFPVKTIMNGNFSNLTSADDWDNIIVQYSQENQFYPYESLATIPIHPDLNAQLTANNCWN